MLLSYVKVPATHYALQFQQGRIRREGLGLSFFYYSPSSTIVAIPMGSTDAPFAFVESTADFQQVTVQGQLTYRIGDPKKVASLLNFSIDSNGRYLADGPDKLQERLVAAAQVSARAVTQSLPLPQLLTSATALGAAVSKQLQQDESIANLGVEILGLSVLSLKPTPEMAKALEADARESLQRKSDEAIYARRNAAVEQERRIKESELNTELAVEEKKRQIREAQMAADISVEEKRALLMDQKVANERKEADSKAYALEATAKALDTMDWKKLMLITPGGSNPRQMMAMAFQDLAGNAAKIGQLNITPDLLQTIMDRPNPRS